MKNIDVNVDDLMVLIKEDLKELHIMTQGICVSNKDDKIEFFNLHDGYADLIGNVKGQCDKILSRIE